ncbi:hypothetical protein Y032_0134g1831 [Ancylostoma ceylanicum]|uniref:Uncharacterized protein n=1 Tax=Ancylostoma ceylanicum TaxID=53326 RepID=A0A016T659_9BILA|nr:hypothetical protein Y032_0134g1831 [Ancylostoma ceylanicum]
MDVVNEFLTTEFHALDRDGASVQRLPWETLKSRKADFHILDDCRSNAVKNATGVKKLMVELIRKRVGNAVSVRKVGLKLSLHEAVTSTDSSSQSYTNFQRKIEVELAC